MSDCSQQSITSSLHSRSVTLLRCPAMQFSPATCAGQSLSLSHGLTLQTPESDRGLISSVGPSVSQLKHVKTEKYINLKSDVAQFERGFLDPLLCKNPSGCWPLQENIRSPDHLVSGTQDTRTCRPAVCLPCASKHRCMAICREYPGVEGTPGRVLKPIYNNEHGGRHCSP